MTNLFDGTPFRISMMLDDVLVLTQNEDRHEREVMRGRADEVAEFLRNWHFIHRQLVAQNSVLLKKGKDEIHGGGSTPKSDG